jgi:hypothetical protein
MSQSSLVRRTVTAVLTAVLCVAGLGAAPTASTASEVSAPGVTADPTVRGAGCSPGEGVTVVVDFTALLDEIRVGCAPGAQPDGMAALAAAGFTVTSESGAGTVCRVDGLPTSGYPQCWLGGYWSYWHKNASDTWAFRSTGPKGTGTLPVDTVEGWSWAGPGGAPRIAASAFPVAASCFAPPQAPALDIIDDDEVLTFSTQDGADVEVAVLTDPAATPSQAHFETRTSLPLTGLSGDVRVLARATGIWCPAAPPLFDATYDVRDAYAPRWSLSTPQNPSPAVDFADTRIQGWATGHTAYEPGPNVSASFQVPQNAYGPVDSSLVVLGDRGRITMTFDSPIADGAGHDLAVFENGFTATNGEDPTDFLELGFVEVSSNGTDFVRFDSASRRSTTVSAFGGSRPTELGGLAGKDLAGKGTPFDLAVLRNAPEVRSGTVDLRRITHVRIADITGDGADVDSFGRPIYDPHPTAGSGGLDLAGIAVLNAYVPLTPTVTLTGTATTYGKAARVAISVAADDVTPTGTVTLLEKGTPLGSATLDAAGRAVIALPARLAVGTHALSAVYAGDDRVAAGPSAPLRLTVGKAPAAAALALGTNRSTYGRAIRATVTVKLPGTAVVPTGTVQLRDGGRVLRNAKLTNGRAVVSLPLRAVGARAITAVYRGSTTASAATSPRRAVRVAKAPTRAIAKLRPRVVRTKARARVTVRVGVPGTSVAANGRVRVIAKAGKRSVTRYGRLVRGTTRVALPRLRTGRYVVRVTYLGTANLRAANVARLTLRVRR